MISVPLRMSRPVIPLYVSQEKKMKRVCAWHKLQEDKHDSSNQNKAWSFWHIILTFFSDICSNVFFGFFGFFCSFVCFEANVMDGNKVTYSHVVVIFRLPQPLSVTSSDRQRSVNCDKYSQLLTVHDVHILPSPPISASHANPAALKL